MVGEDTELGEEEPVWAIQTGRVAFRCGGCGGKGIVFGQERWRQEKCLGRKGGGRNSVWAGKEKEVSAYGLRSERTCRCSFSFSSGLWKCVAAVILGARVRVSLIPDQDTHRRAAYGLCGGPIRSLVGFWVQVSAMRLAVRVTWRCRRSCELRFCTAGFREVSGLVHVSDGRALVLARRGCGLQCVGAEGL